MRGNSNLRLYQFELPLGKRVATRAAWQPKQRVKHRVNSPVLAEDYEGCVKRPNTRISQCSIPLTSSPIPTRSPSSCLSYRESHDCVSMDQDKTTNQSSQHILVGSALRRPHASHFSPLDYQSMPDVGKSPRQPYKSNNACTVFTYANRPVSAMQVPKHLGKHTKSSLLRSKSVSCGSLDSSSTNSSCGNYSRASSAMENKRLCVVRQDYRFFTSGSCPRQIAPHGQSMHAFLTGARYNSVRYLDSRTLSKLGVYIPKEGLNTFFVKDDPTPTDEINNEADDTISIGELEKAGSEDTPVNRCKVSTSDKAVNTDPHYLSISRWQSAEWKSERSKPDPGTRAHTAPLNRYKAIKAYYCDYNTQNKQTNSSKTRPGTCR